MRLPAHHAVYPEGEVMMALSHATPYLIRDLVTHPHDLWGEVLADEVFNGCAKAERSRRSTRSITAVRSRGN